MGGKVGLDARAFLFKRALSVKAALASQVGEQVLKRAQVLSLAKRRV